MNFVSSLNERPATGAVFYSQCRNPMNRKSPHHPEVPQTDPAKPEAPKSEPSDAANPEPVTKPKTALGSSLNFALRKIKQKAAR